MKRLSILAPIAVLAFLASSASAHGQANFLPQKAATGFCYNATSGWIKINSLAAASSFTPQESVTIYGLNGTSPAGLQCDANGNLYAGDFYQGASLPATCSPGQVFTTVITGSATPYYCSAANTWQGFGGSGTFNTLTQDATSTSTGGQTEVVGLLTHALPSLATGYLNWTGTAWAFSAAGGMVWPTTAGIPYWTSGTAWGGAYNASTTIPANYLPTGTSSTQGALLLGAAGGANVYLGYTPANCTAGTTGSDCLQLSSGLVPAANLPAPTASTLGGIESITSLAHNWVAYIDTSGVPHQSQPAISDLTATFSSPLSLSTNTLACPTCLTATSPTAGLASFAGGGQGMSAATAAQLGTVANLPQYSIPYSAGTSSALTDVASPTANGVYANGWNITGSAAAAPVSFQLTGSGISCTGSPLVCTISGGTGSGTVTAAAQYDVPYYTQTGTTAQVGGAAINGFQFDSTTGAPAAATAAQLGTLIDLASGAIPKSGGTSSALVASALSDNGTTVSSSEPLSVTGNITSTGSGSFGSGAPTCGTGVTGCDAYGEASTAVTAATGVDTVRADSTAHGFKVSLNDGSEFLSLMNFAGDGSTLTESGTTLSCTTATSSQIGCAKFGTGLTVSAGSVTPTFGTATNQVAEGGVITAGGPTGGATSIPVITYNGAGQLTAVTAATPTVATVQGGATNDVLYQTAANTTGFITPVNSAVLITSSGGVPSESTTLPAVSGANLTSLNGSSIASGTVSASYLPTATNAALGVAEAGTGIGVSAGVFSINAQYRTWACETGVGDGLNAIPAGTYLQSFCYNTTGVSVTLTGLKCYIDGGSSSTMNAAGNTLGALLTGAVTCSTSFASGTQSANVTLTSTDYIKFTFVADGTAKQSTWVVTGTF